MHELDAQDEEFVWPGQTRVFPFAGGVSAGTLSFEAVTPVTLTQLQLVAADRSRS